MLHVPGLLIDTLHHSHRLRFNLASPCSARQSKISPVPSNSARTDDCAPPPELVSHHPFRRAMKAADVSKWTYRDSGGDSDVASVSKRALLSSPARFLSYLSHSLT